MKHLKKTALWASILPVAALAACAKEIQFRVPALNEADQARLTCRDYPMVEEALAEIPPHIFLTGTDGTPVVTPDGNKWVSFKRANEREAVYVKVAWTDGSGSHFECQDNLKWLAAVWTGLQSE